ncbi:MAG: hypothetical protein HYR75_02700 [Gemmatimonadetes bacterium]|nr:hypothetical protein [Gemmatimonadota bacterium]MBI3567899.1 hypothetical protein [Gemmatimonadota bacterium]
MRFRSVALTFLATLLAPFALGAQSTVPANGTAVLDQMRAMYAGRWYTTLTFVQKTTLHRPDGSDTVQTWFESLRYTPERSAVLRIDVAPLSAGNGTISTWDSTYVVRGGKVSATRASGNSFLPFIESVYLQPAERTARELAPLSIDLSKVRADTWEGRPVWVVGAAAGDSTSAQFWVDVGRQLVVRMIVLGSATRPPLDVRLAGYVQTGGGWLATSIEMYSGGTKRQAEDYSDWKTGMTLHPDLFEASKWAATPHWATGSD